MSPGSAGARKILPPEAGAENVFEEEALPTERGSPERLQEAAPGLRLKLEVGRHGNHRTGFNDDLFAWIEVDLRGGIGRAIVDRYMHDAPSMCSSPTIPWATWPGVAPWSRGFATLASVGRRKRLTPSAAPAGGTSPCGWGAMERE